uniref:Uncharacterized protein n=1 Tax=Rhizophora mucronata TaxID=61149 RepID=A0A2P2PJS2_RHIMU
MANRNTPPTLHKIEWPISFFPSLQGNLSSTTFLSLAKAQN